MNIGIITQPLNGNFGGIMQNYALQTILKDLGHCPITIDYVQTVPFYLLILSHCKTLLQRIVLRRDKSFVKRVKTRGNKKGNRFIDKYIDKTNYITKYSSNIIEKYNFDALIVGSDQVWRRSYNSDLEDMYLRFAKKSKIKKLAFAASFGVSEQEYTNKEITRCKKLINKFDEISVRERSGVDLCKSYFDKDVEWILDPTFLLPKSHYLELISHIPKDKSDYIGVYILDVSEEKMEIVNSMAKETGVTKLRIVSNAQEDITVEEWLALFRDAKYVVTDSFHGTVFSIIFQKPFIAISNTERGLDRFKSLLSFFSLDNCLVGDKKFRVPTFNTLDWERIRDRILLNRTKALEFLQSSLGETH